MWSWACPCFIRERKQMALSRSPKWRLSLLHQAERFESGTTTERVKRSQSSGRTRSYVRGGRGAEMTWESNACIYNECVSNTKRGELIGKSTQTSFQFALHGPPLTYIRERLEWRVGRRHCWWVCGASWTRHNNSLHSGWDVLPVLHFRSGRVYCPWDKQICTWGVGGKE